MTRPPTEPFRRMLHDKVASLIDHARKNNGELSEQKLGQIHRLAQLIDIEEKLKIPERQRWPVILVLVGVLVLASILLFARLEDTEVELDLRLNEVSFFAPTQMYFDRMKLEALGASDLAEIVIQGTQKVVETDLLLKTLTNTEGGETGTIDFLLVLPPRTQVSVQHSGKPHQIRLSLQGPQLAFDVSVHGLIEFRFSGPRKAERRPFEFPQAIRLRPASNQVDLDLTFSEPMTGPLTTQLPIEDLNLLRVDHVRASGRTIIRHVSTIQAGKIYLEALNGKQRLLRPGEEIRFNAIHGEIRSLELRDDHIALKFHGQVREMTAGSGKNRHSLMPAYIEWLSARQPLSLLWGVAVSVFTIVISVLRWWGVKL